MGTRVFDNANDLITFSRNSGGTSLRKISYGNELVRNGTFNTDVSEWTQYGVGSISLMDTLSNVREPPLSRL